MKYVFDLDGTLCTQERSGEYHQALPIFQMIEKVRQLKKDGHIIVIHTARGMNTYKGNISEIIYNISKMTEDWLRKYDVPFDEIFYGKPAGDFYIDDKGINSCDFIKS
jgi:capsule biosynthesis phosphatase